MSYILEALKKADRERAAGNVPDLETVHRRDTTARKSYRWLWILAALFIFNGLLVALLATRHDTGPGEDELARRAAPTERSPPSPDTTRPPAPVQARPPVRKPPTTVVGAASQAPARSTSAAPGTVYPPVRAATVQEQGAAAPAVVVPPAPAPAVMQPSVPSAAASPPSVPTPGTVHGKIPEWDELSLEFRSGFSMPRMDVHVYDTNPQRRFVLIDLQKYREGDRLPNGAVIEKILPDGIELSYQGTRFHYTK
jgi:general secretion pathway protein B